MRKIVLAALILAVTASAADARRRHHHRFYVYKHAPVMLMAPDAGETCAPGAGAIDSPGNSSRATGS